MSLRKAFEIIEDGTAAGEEIVKAVLMPRGWDPGLKGSGLTGYRAFGEAELLEIIRANRQSGWFDPADAEEARLAVIREKSRRGFLSQSYGHTARKGDVSVPAVVRYSGMFSPEERARLERVSEMLPALTEQSGLLERPKPEIRSAEAGGWYIVPDENGHR